VKPSNWKKIEKEVEGLSLKDQARLLSRLAQRLGPGGKRKGSRDWTKLYGLGKGLWNGEDAQTYVNRRRKARLESAYKRMAQDESREAQALEWSEATVGDVSDEAR